MSRRILIIIESNKPEGENIRRMLWAVRNKVEMGAKTIETIII